MPQPHRRLCMHSLSRRTLFLLAVIVLTGCKLGVITGEGGGVITLSGNHFCSTASSTASYCVIEISDTSFAETFTAVPDEGYEFVRWQGGTDFLCGNSTDPSCTVSIAGNAFAAVIVGSYAVNYIMPIFKDVGIDTDGDGVINRIDPDDDNDGILDEDDPCPLALLCGTAGVIEQLAVTECSTGGERLYQSFTATETGTVGELGLAIDGGLGSLWLYVHQGSDGTGPVIYDDYSVRTGDATIIRPITHSGFDVVEGQVYTLEFWAGVGSWSFCGDSTNPYPDGAAFDGTLPAGWDLGMSIEINY